MDGAWGAGRAFNGNVPGPTDRADEHIRIGAGESRKAKEVPEPDPAAPVHATIDVEALREKVQRLRQVCRAVDDLVAEIATIEQRMAAEAATLCDHSAPLFTGEDCVGRERDELLGARRLRRRRALRERFFAPVLFGEPAWDLLLDLFEAHRSARMVELDALLKAAGGGERAARRWFAVLEAEGLAARVPGPGASELVEITAQGIEGFSAYFAALGRDR